MISDVLSTGAAAEINGTFIAGAHRQQPTLLKVLLCHPHTCALACQLCQRVVIEIPFILKLKLGARIRRYGAGSDVFNKLRDTDFSGTGNVGAYMFPPIVALLGQVGVGGAAMVDDVGNEGTSVCRLRDTDPPFHLLASDLTFLLQLVDSRIPHPGDLSHGFDAHSRQYLYLSLADSFNLQNGVFVENAICLCVISLHPSLARSCLFDFTDLIWNAFVLVLGYGDHPTIGVVVDREALAVQLPVLVPHKTTPQAETDLLVILDLVPPLCRTVVVVDVIQRHQLLRVDVSQELSLHFYLWSRRSATNNKRDSSHPRTQPVPQSICDPPAKSMNAGRR